MVNHDFGRVLVIRDANCVILNIFWSAFSSVLHCFAKKCLVVLINFLFAKYYWIIFSTHIDFTIVCEKTIHVADQKLFLFEELADSFHAWPSSESLRDAYRWGLMDLFLVTQCFTSLQKCLGRELSSFVQTAMRSRLSVTSVCWIFLYSLQKCSGTSLVFRKNKTLWFAHVKSFFKNDWISFWAKIVTNSFLLERIRMDDTFFLL